MSVASQKKTDCNAIETYDLRSSSLQSFALITGTKSRAILVYKSNPLVTLPKAPEIQHRSFDAPLQSFLHCFLSPFSTLPFVVSLVSPLLRLCHLSGVSLSSSLRGAPSPPASPVARSPAVGVVPTSTVDLSLPQLPSHIQSILPVPTSRLFLLSLGRGPSGICCECLRPNVVLLRLTSDLRRNSTGLPAAEICAPLPPVG